ncbi:MAG TPA: 3-isopropylmalate dehydratase small subunit [Vicinamibacterales bacterium]|nr:3-isopropylmalate dehydratase small subunit [Vicinamibacterales bacterium]
MSASAITRVAGRAVVVPGADIDTDRIIPARHLKSITFDGLGARVFEDDRRQAAASGQPHPLDRPGAEGARVLIAGSNFGCGSSREHAPRALHQWGIRAGIAESFAEIFASNSVAIGFVCARVTADDWRELVTRVESDPSAEVVVDLERMQVAIGEWSVPASMPDAERTAVMTGQWDGTNLLLDRHEEVEAVRARLPYGVRRGSERGRSGVGGGSG